MRMKALVRLLKTGVSIRNQWSSAKLLAKQSHSPSKSNVVIFLASFGIQESKTNTSLDNNLFLFFFENNTWFCIWFRQQNGDEHSICTQFECRLQSMSIPVVMRHEFGSLVCSCPVDWLELFPNRLIGTTKTRLPE